MFEFTEVFIQRWRSIIIVTLIIPVIIILLTAPVVHANSRSLKASPEATYDDGLFEAESDTPNVITNVFANVANDTNQAATNARENIVSGVVSFSAAVTEFEKSVASGTTKAAASTYRAASEGLSFAGMAVSGTVGFVGHATSKVFGFFSGVAKVSSIIRPESKTQIPSITKLRTEQAAIIQKDTKVVTIKPKLQTRGGACDNGHGNGGYPAKWCNAPMDTRVTIPYSNSRINRECTSYAYWYFTKVGGNKNFRVKGDAKYWAFTSNYPTHNKPTVGAIAVETGGAYGHVAIVRALPGQKFGTKKVPKGYILVSEMNYDWAGHFRYSYAPVGKFDTYIYN